MDYVACFYQWGDKILFVRDSQNRLDVVGTKPLSGEEDFVALSRASGENGFKPDLAYTRAAKTDDTIYYRSPLRNPIELEEALFLTPQEALGNKDLHPELPDIIRKVFGENH